jgi:hypothetical protein
MANWKERKKCRRNKGSWKERKNKEIKTLRRMKEAERKIA